MPNGFDVGYEPPLEAPLPPPTTGLATRTYSTITPPQPSGYDAAEVIRQQINAMQFKQAKDALEAASMYQRVRAYENAVREGATPAEALARTAAFAPPAAAARIFQATQPAFTPTTTNFPGVEGPVLRSGRYGERLQFPPSTTGRMSIEPEIRIVKDPKTGRDVSMARTGPNSWKPVSDLDEEQKAALSLNIAKTKAIQNAQAWNLTPEQTTNAVETLRKEREDILKKKEAVPTVPSGSMKRLRFDPKTGQIIPIE